MPDHLETLRANYERWGAGDWSDASFWDRHAVYVSQASELDPGPHFGLDAVADYLRRFLTSWDGMRIEARSFRAFGDTFVVQVHRSATGRESGIPLEGEAFHVWTFRGDKVIRLEVFEQEPDALAAAGADGTPENIEVVRRLYEAVAAGDRETVMAIYDPEVEFDATQLRDEAIAATEIVRGHDGLRRFFREWSEAWEKSDFELDELVEAGDRVVACVTRRGRGRASGVEVEMPGGAVWTIQNGRIIRAAFFSTPSEALVAAGIGE